MPNRYFEKDGDDMYVGGGYGGISGAGFGGGFAFLLIALIVIWFLCRDGHRDDHGGYGGHNMPYPYPYPPYAPFANNCSPLDCKIPMVPDMSNCEVDKDLWKVDADVWKSACETQKVVACGDQKILDKICEQENQALRDKLAEVYADKAALKTQMYTDAKFDALNAMLCKYDNGNDKQYYMLNSKIDNLACELPKRPPIWCEGITPNTHHTDCHDRFRFDDFPRRRHHNRCDNDCFDGCGCN